MAHSFTSASDYIEIPLNVNIGNTISFWLKTTATTVNIRVLGKHSTTTRLGPIVYLNNTAGKLGVSGYTSGSEIFKITSTTSVNNGAWHHVCIQWGYAGSSPVQLWVNGVLEASGTAGATWGGTTLPMRLGKGPDSFWANPDFELAEFAAWDVAPSSSLNLNADDIAALAKGASPLSVRPNRLVAYCPLSSDVRDIFGADGAGTPTIVGTAVTEHPRIYP